MLSRRGFLKTLGAALATAAVFEPKSLLWVPKLQAQHAPEIVTVESDAALRVLIERQLAMNDLALRFATTMGDRLQRHRAIALHEVLYRMNGNVLLTPQHLFEQPAWSEELDAGRFQATERTMLVRPAHFPAEYGTGRSGRDAAIDSVAGEMLANLQGVDMFAPIGTELRPGEAFADGTIVGVATDPESGISARALTVQSNRRRESLIGFEIAAGKWTTPVIDRPAPIVAYCPECAIGLSDDGYGDFHCPGCETTWPDDELRRV